MAKTVPAVAERRSADEIRQRKLKRPLKKKSAKKIAIPRAAILGKVNGFTVTRLEPEKLKTICIFPPQKLPVETKRVTFSSADITDQENESRTFRAKNRRTHSARDSSDESSGDFDTSREPKRRRTFETEVVEDADIRKATSSLRQRKATLKHSTPAETQDGDISKHKKTYPRTPGAVEKKSVSACETFEEDTYDDYEEGDSIEAKVTLERLFENDSTINETANGTLGENSPGARRSSESAAVSRADEAAVDSSDPTAEVEASRPSDIAQIPAVEAQRVSYEEKTLGKPHEARVEVPEILPSEEEVQEGPVNARNSALKVEDFVLSLADDLEIVGDKKVLNPTLDDVPSKLESVLPIQSDLAESILPNKSDPSLPQMMSETSALQKTPGSGLSPDISVSKEELDISVAPCGPVGRVPTDDSEPDVPPNSPEIGASSSESDLPMPSSESLSKALSNESEADVATNTPEASATESVSIHLPDDLPNEAVSGDLPNEAVSGDLPNDPGSSVSLSPLDEKSVSRLTRRDSAADSPGIDPVGDVFKQRRSQVCLEDEEPMEISVIQVPSRLSEKSPVEVDDENPEKIHAHDFNASSAVAESGAPADVQVQEVQNTNDEVAILLNTGDAPDKAENCSSGNQMDPLALDTDNALRKSPVEAQEAPKNHGPLPGHRPRIPSFVDDDDIELATLSERIRKISEHVDTMEDCVVAEEGTPIEIEMANVETAPATGETAHMTTETTTEEFLPTAEAALREVAVVGPASEDPSVAEALESEETMSATGEAECPVKVASENMIEGPEAQDVENPTNQRDAQTVTGSDSKRDGSNESEKAMEGSSDAEPYRFEVTENSVESAKSSEKRLSTENDDSEVAQDRNASPQKIPEDGDNLDVVKECEDPLQELTHEIPEHAGKNMPEASEMEADGGNPDIDLGYGSQTQTTKEESLENRAVSPASTAGCATNLDGENEVALETEAEPATLPEPLGGADQGLLSGRRARRSKVPFSPHCSRVSTATPSTKTRTTRPKSTVEPLAEVESTPRSTRKATSKTSSNAAPGSKAERTPSARSKASKMVAEESKMVAEESKMVAEESKMSLEEPGTSDTSPEELKSKKTPAAKVKAAKAATGRSRAPKISTEEAETPQTSPVAPKVRKTPGARSKAAKTPAIESNASEAAAVELDSAEISPSAAKTKKTPATKSKTVKTPTAGSKTAKATKEVSVTPETSPVAAKAPKTPVRTTGTKKNTTKASKTPATTSKANSKASPPADDLSDDSASPPAKLSKSAVKTSKATTSTAASRRKTTK